MLIFTFRFFAEEVKSVNIFGYDGHYLEGNGTILPFFFLLLNKVTSDTSLWTAALVHSRASLMSSGCISPSVCLYSLATVRVKWK